MLAGAMMLDRLGKKSRERLGWRRSASRGPAGQDLTPISAELGNTGVSPTA